MNKQIFILAGPNGAGKTTFAREFLPAEANCLRFINANLIAAGLSPFDPEASAVRAGRLMLEEINASVARGEGFTIETTLAGKGYARKIRHWQRRGYHVTLYFLGLPDSETAIQPVALRVAQGGHHIPNDVVRRRFEAGRRNLERLYKPIVNTWAFYDNTGDSPVLMDWNEPDDQPT